MKYVKVEEKNKVNVVTIESENPLNPLNMDILREVGQSISESKNVVVLNSKGKAFSAGADIKNFTKMDAVTANRFAREGHDIMNSIAQADVPVIAAIHGYALGGGFELALACDFRVSTPGAKLALPEITLGILPGFAGTQRLKAIAGEGRALELVSTGRTITGEEAMNMGIVNRVSEDYLDEAVKFAEELSNRPPLSLKYTKALIRSPPDEFYDDEIEKFGVLFNTADSKEGFDAFLNKRKPVFKGE